MLKLYPSISLRMIAAAVLVMCLTRAHLAQESTPVLEIPQLPPIETELSRIENVSLVRIEEFESEDELTWGSRRDRWKYEQHNRRNRELRVKDETLLEILCGEARISPLRVFGSERLPDGRYNLIVQKLPGSLSRKTAFEKVVQVLQNTFDLKIERERRPVKVLTLMQLSDKSGKPVQELKRTHTDDNSQSISTSSNGDGVTEVEYEGSLESFSEYLEEEFDEAVVNTVKFRGKVALKFDHETVPDIEDEEYEFYDSDTMAELKRRRFEDLNLGLKKYGLALQKTEQKLEGLFISSSRTEKLAKKQDVPAAQSASVDSSK